MEGDMASPRERPLWEKIVTKIPIVGQFVNLFRHHHPFPYGLGGGTVLILTLLVVGAIVAMLLPIFFSIGGTQGVIAGAQRVFTGARDTAEDAAGEYTETIQRAMGISYASEVDQHADRDIGLRLEDVEPSDRRYMRRDPITVWGILSGNSPGEDGRIMNVNLSCLYRPPGQGVVPVEGHMDNSEFIIDRDMSRSFTCEFPRGTLVDDTQGAHSVEIDADFDFETMAYFTIPFMDEEAFLALRRSDPARVDRIQATFTAQNTYSPVEIGVGSRDFPILISSRGDSRAYLGFSINNEWGGVLTDLHKFNIMMPNGVVIESCDSPIDFVPQETDEFFTNYTMVEEGIEHLRSRLRTGERYDRFEPQSFRCFIDFDPEIIFAERSRLDPVELNIFPHIEFDYSLQERVQIDLREFTELRLDASPLPFSLEDKPEITISSRTSTLQSAELTVRHRAMGELSSEEVSDLVGVPMQRMGDDFGYLFRDSIRESIPGIERGDTLIFRVDVVNDDGEEDYDIIAPKIENNPPELFENTLLFRDMGPEDNEAECRAKVIDKDGDDIEDASFTFRNRRLNYRNVVSGACEEKEEYWLCISRIRVDDFEEDDVLECSVTLYDGIDYNTPSRTAEKRLGDMFDSAIPEEFEDEDACEPTDSPDIRVRRTTKGLMEVEGDVSFRERTDTCLDDDTLRLFYCDTDTNRMVYDDVTCDCYNGVCI